MRTRQPSLVWVTDQLAVGAAPLSYRQLADLHDQGVSAILNLCDEFCDLPGIERDHGFEVRHLPIPDEAAPDLAALEEALAWLDEAVYLGKKIFIHCRHGIGRTGTVLNAYLLRRGLGHWAAGRILARLGSKPANFRQWRAVRRYGKAAGRLTVREPRLEFARLTDLKPFLDDFAGLVKETEDAMAAASPGLPRCGREHHGCCHRQVRLTLIEAMDLAWAIDRELTGEKRRELMERANRAFLLEGRGLEDRERPNSHGEGAGPGPVSVASMLRIVGAAPGTPWSREPGSPGERGEDLPPGADIVCPLLEAGRCLLFYSRPLRCRTHGMPADAAERLWRDVSPSLDRLSGQAFLALSGAFPPRSPLSFSISEVVSGRYVQLFFHRLRLASSENE